MTNDDTQVADGKTDILGEAIDREYIAQSVEVGPVKVDTGNDWLDFTFALVLLGAFVAGTVIVKRMR
jgi:hypothetical protein